MPQNVKNNCNHDSKMVGGICGKGLFFCPLAFPVGTFHETHNALLDTGIHLNKEKRVGVRKVLCRQPRSLREKINRRLLTGSRHKISSADSLLCFISTAIVRVEVLDV